MRKPNKEIRLTSYDELIGGAMGGMAVQVRELPLAELHDFKDHPFRVVDDEKMEETAESIRQHGVLMPGLARPGKQGGYEIIAGHRRKRGCELAGLETMPFIVKDYTDDESTVIMVDSNIQREDILPSEKARAYRMKYEALKHQGSKAGGSTLEAIGEDAGESAKTVQRYIYLSRLTDGLLELVDMKKLPFLSGVELSFLPDAEQAMVEKVFSDVGTGMATSQAEKIRGYSQAGELTEAVIRLILEDVKPKPRKVTIRPDRLSEYFGEEMSSEEIEETIYRLLDEWREKGGRG